MAYAGGGIEIADAEMIKKKNSFSKQRIKGG